MSSESLALRVLTADYVLSPVFGQKLNLGPTNLMGKNVLSSPIDKTRTEMVSMMNAGTLIVGQKYRMTDYRTIHMMGTWGDVVVYNTGELEPLTLTASAVNAFERRVTSELFPQDIIEYAITYTGERVDIWQMGKITYRKDTERELTARYDWRNYKTRLWLNGDTGLYTVRSPNDTPTDYRDRTTFDLSLNTFKVDIQAQDETPALIIRATIMRSNFGFDCGDFVIDTPDTAVIEYLNVGNGARSSTLVLSGQFSHIDIRDHFGSNNLIITGGMVGMSVGTNFDGNNITISGANSQGVTFGNDTRSNTIVTALLRYCEFGPGFQSNSLSITTEITNTSWGCHCYGSAISAASIKGCTFGNMFSNYSSIYPAENLVGHKFELVWSGVGEKRVLHTIPINRAGVLALEPLFVPGARTASLPNWSYTGNIIGTNVEGRFSEFNVGFVRVLVSDTNNTTDAYYETNYHFTSPGLDPVVLITKITDGQALGFMAGSDGSFWGEIKLNEPMQVV